MNKKPPASPKADDVSVDLSGKVALITGSTSGMGEAMAIQLARNGAQVILHGIDSAAVNSSVQDKVEAASGKRSYHFPHNLEEPEQCKELIDSAIQLAGRIDILINNAGIQHVSPIDAFGVSDWQRVLNVNLNAPFLLSKLVIPAMKDRTWGRIINTSSTLGERAERHKAAYVTSKHGLNGLTRAIAVDTATSGITCNAIMPGWVLTPLCRRQVESTAKRLNRGFDDTAKSEFLWNQPTERFVEVDEVAAVALYLCSNAAASITGAMIPVDGGQMSI